MTTGATILVVDDDEQILGLMRALLRHHGFNPITSSSVDGLLSAFGDVHPDLILLDLGLSGITGSELIGRFRKSGVHAPVIIVSGRSPSAEELSMIDPAEVVPKPFEVPRLIDAVRRALSATVC